MAYTKNPTWNEGAAPGISASCLNHIEDGIYNAASVADLAMPKAGGTATGTHDYTEATLQWSRDTDNAKIYFKDEGVDNDNLWVEFGDDSSAKVVFAYKVNGGVADPVFEIRSGSPYAHYPYIYEGNYVPWLVGTVTGKVTVSTNDPGGSNGDIWLHEQA